MGLLLASISNLLATVDFAPVIEPILEVLNAILWPAIAIVGAVGTIYCIRQNRLSTKSLVTISMLLLFCDDEIKNAVPRLLCIM